MIATVETPRPSQAEELRAEYGDRWDIWREVLPTGRHGDWLAETVPAAPEHAVLRASSIDELARLLREEDAQ
ncbi:hypothetical protein [Actinomadura chibensis]|uniref:Uncharacterized protein n=1 Tax=Actinomadura chibensis TaxID=392828 RepID=A0A5D0NIK0_9ACTN|nr:hypothetical protein [Actinomadura chibensis]TYB44202.1 hypothetical protein FXF69_24955 [Actinomadura chibensis]